MAQFWLIKSEPDVYSIEHLKKDKKTWWEGVRNYQARNFMMKEMKAGDQILFYHSSADPTGIAGLAEVSREAQADQLQFDRKSDFFDAKAKPEQPIWFCVEVAFVERFKKFIPLELIRSTKALSEMKLLQKGQRLSVQPVTAKEFELILKLAVESKK